MNTVAAAGSGAPAPGSVLSGRTALVTGAGSGIGRACAVALAAAGAAVHAVDVDAASAHATALAVGGKAHVVDLADADAIASLPGDVDVLVNNAGFQHVAPLEAFPLERFERMQRVMVTAPLLLMQHCLPHMRRGGWGRIVNVSSVHGLRASANKAGYVAAKHALEGLSKVAAVEGAPHGVTSNCVNPGYVRTPLVERQLDDLAAAGPGREEALAHVLLDRTPVKRLLEPEEVAAAVVWLCGPGSGFVTGSSLTLDGGWTAN
ncbi:3-hydroxybutyrate dehydrogenase [Glycomyces terrestris]|uniref:SDR family oxidoreductase n=1 Tax=Glycomyces terrestris TaxID=2493553 RepID=A0A426UVE7_9ACTN|nr:3-hydroxybutyrate dehydrogenase [Glycomyces terrestris]RRR98171.1 SDR family oxidoreductase [Glycomyces terrestris]